MHISWEVKHDSDSGSWFWKNLVFLFLSSSNREGEAERWDWSNETAWSQPPFRSRKHAGHILPSFLLIRAALSLTMAARFHVSEAGTQTQTHQQRLSLCRSFDWGDLFGEKSCYRSVHVQNNPDDSLGGQNVSTWNSFIRNQPVSITHFSNKLMDGCVLAFLSINIITFSVLW